MMIKYVQSPWFSHIRRMKNRYGLGAVLWFLEGDNSNKSF